MAALPELINDRLLRAAFGEEVDRVPVWIMRQAGRYLPEFRELREKHDFFTLCQTPKLAVEATLQPVHRFDLDAAIIFSDILVIPQAFGMEIKMVPGAGPVFDQPLRDPNDIQNLDRNVDVREKLSYVFDAINLCRQQLNGKIPLIGFAGAPFTLMGYMIEGGASKTMSKTKSWLYRFPLMSQVLLQLITSTTVDYLVEQVAAGAQALQLFESNADCLGPELFSEFALPYLQEINEKVKSGIEERGLGKIPMILYAKGIHYALKDLSGLGYEVISLDWTMDPEAARNLVGANITLQGNLDPCALYSSPDKLWGLTQEMVAKFGMSRYIANLGHGIYPDIEPDSVETFVTAVHEYDGQVTYLNE